MKSMILALLIIVLVTHPSLQCGCKEKCTKCCKSGEFKLVPLYELFESRTGQYFYTVSLREMNTAIKERGYIRKRIIGLVAVGEVDCKTKKTLVPVKRFVNKDSDDYVFQTDDVDVHRGIKYSIEGVAFYGATTENQCLPTIPLYRFWTGKVHIYSTDLVVGKERAGKDGVNEGLIINIWPVPNPETTAAPTTTTTPLTTTRDPLDNPGSCTMALTKLFGLYRNSTDSFLYTPSYPEMRDAYETKNYDPQVSPGFVAGQQPSCRCNLSPVYRLERAQPKQDQFFTTNKKEADNAVSALGYTNLGISYYCAEKLYDCGASVPYYRYVRKNDLQNHLYTVDKTDDAASKATFEGILCYIWPPQN